MNNEEAIVQSLQNLFDIATRVVEKLEQLEERLGRLENKGVDE